MNTDIHSTTRNMHRYLRRYRVANSLYPNAWRRKHAAWFVRCCEKSQKNESCPKIFCCIHGWRSMRIVTSQNRPQIKWYPTFSWMAMMHRVITSNQHTETTMENTDVNLQFVTQQNRCYPKWKHIWIKCWKCIVTSFYSLILLLVAINPPISCKLSIFLFAFWSHKKHNFSNGPKWQEFLLRFMI